MTILSNLIKFQNLNNTNKTFILNNINNNINSFSINKISTDVDLDMNHIGGIGNLTNHIHTSFSKGLLHNL